MKEEFKKGGEADRACHMGMEEGAIFFFFCCCVVLQPGKQEEREMMPWLCVFDQLPRILPF